jgi:hypothetical protein
MTMAISIKTLPRSINMIKQSRDAFGVVMFIRERGMKKQGGRG